MHTISILRWLFFILSVSCLLTCDGAVTGGFSDCIPPEPHDVVYGAYYHNYPNAQLGTLSAALSPDATTKLFGSSSAHEGDAIVAHVLLPFPSNYCNDTAHATALLSTTFSKIDPRIVSKEVGIGLVLLFRPAENETASSVLTDQPNWMNVSCVLDAVEAYNAREAIPRVTAVAWAGHSPKYRFTPSETLQLPRDLLRVYDFALLAFSVQDSVQEWEDLSQAASFNRARWAQGHPFPHHILETRSGLYLTHDISKNTVSHKSGRVPISGVFPREDEEKQRESEGAEREAHPNAPNCLLLPRPSCVPLGGWTVWTTNAPTEWEWTPSSKNGFTKHTTPGAAALFIPSTSPTFVHGAAPGANAAASAIVTGLAILDAAEMYARRAAEKKMAKPRDIYAFFFPGEHMGGVGSARFFADAMHLDCHSLEACTSLAYGTALNFTTVNISAIDTFIALDQLAQEDAPLYFHVDARVPNGAAQRAAENALKNFGTRRAGTSHLPYSPITTLLDDTRAAPPLRAEERETRVMLTLTRYNTRYVDPFVFTPSDIAHRVPRLHASALAEAANAALRVLFPRERVAANATRIGELWNCFAAGLSCEAVFPSGTTDVKSAAERMDYTLKGFAPITAAQRAVEAALRFVGWNPLRAPAIPRALRVPQGKWFHTKWSFDEEWIRTKYDTRYAAVMAESVMNENRGARSAMISSEIVNVTFLLVSCAIGILVMLGACMCVRLKL